MKHTVTYLAVLFLFVSALLGEKAHSQGTDQTASVRVDLMMSPRPSPYLSDWTSHQETVQLTLTLTGAQSAQVRLAAQVTLNGQTVAVTNIDKMPVLTLHEGANGFNGADIIPLHAVSFQGNIDASAQRLGRLPEGQYEICVAAIPYPEVVKPSGQVCRPFQIQDVEPPVLISPADGSIFEQNNLTANRTETVSQNETISNAPSVTLAALAAMNTNSLADLKAFDLTSGNDHIFYSIDPKITERYSAEAMQIPIMFRFISDAAIPYADNALPAPSFSWLPPSPVPAMAVTYRLRIVPVLPGQNASSAVASGTSLGKDILLLGKLSCDIISEGHADVIITNLSRTHRFAWAVQAQDVNGNPIGKNNGWSKANIFECDGGIFTPPWPDTLPNDRPIGTNFSSIDTPKKKLCGYTWIEKEVVRTVASAWAPGESKGNLVKFTRTIYNVHRQFVCSLWEGHGGVHHGTMDEVLVISHTEEKWSDARPDIGPSQGGVPVETDIKKKKVLTKEEFDRAPKTSAEADEKEKKDKEKKEKDEKEKKDKSGSSGTTPKTEGTPGGGLPGTRSSFFDVFQTVDLVVPFIDTIKNAPCPYMYKKSKGNIYVKDNDGLCKMYAVYEIFRCSLLKGHSGPHHGTIETNYVYRGKVTCPDGRGDPEPPKEKVMKGEELDKIPSKEEADKADVPGVGVGGGGVKKVPCPYFEKKLLRTVVGPWKKISTTVRHISWHGTTVAWADVVWQRDVFNVFSVSHCTLDKGHAGAHKMGPPKEEKEKYGSFTEKVTYGPGEPQVPPHPHATDSLPEE
jgi:hypothetical protein